MEIFKDVKGYEGFYQVSNYGNVKSLARKGRKKDILLKPSKDKNGYYYIVFCHNHISKTVKIHQLVAIAFLNHYPNRYDGLIVDHIDNNPSNNTLSNIQLITSRENTSKDKKGDNKYTGVYFDKRYNNFSSRIMIGKDKVHLGCFENDIDASNIYQKALLNLNKYNGKKIEFRNYLNSI
tara:strand:+ start:117 stop:653 length:537 start_codon:yes stop_codon:yes gene_type:complete